MTGEKRRRQKVNPGAAIPARGRTPKYRVRVILYSKAKRKLSLLPVTYYNIHGPTHYHPLQSQGAPGEGDKETYGWAAEALGMPVYHIKEPVKALDIFNHESGSREGSAMVQYDPRDDYISTRRKKKSAFLDRVNPPKHTLSSFLSAKPNPPTSVPPLRLTRQSPSSYMLIPEIQSATISACPGPTHNPDGSFRRVSEDGDTMNGFGFDVERQFWVEIKWTSCELEMWFKT